MAEKAYITSEILKWARESAKISIEYVAKYLKVKEDRIINWENGDDYPTISQAEKLAKLYKRPFAVFFLPSIPKDFQPLQDFRRKDSSELSTSSIFIIREIQQKQAWTRELYIENNDPKLPFVGKYSIDSDPNIVAKDIIKTLNINVGFYDNKPIRNWIDACESNGIFISRTSFIHSRLKLDSDEIQGFVIADEYAPFIFINSDDWNAPQLFTLVHEIAHIWIAESGISNNIEISQHQLNKDKLHPIELFCNEVAACALMPEDLIRELIKGTLFTAGNLFKIAKNIGVSNFALIYRLLNLKIISLAEYNSLKIKVEKDFQDFLIREEAKATKLKEKKSGPSYFLLQLNRNSRLFTQIVLDTYKNGFVEPTLASNLLNVQVNKFPKLELQMYKYI